MSKYWDIEEGEIDSTVFFELLPKYFGEATSIFVEGTSIEKEVISCYQKHQEKGKHLPGRQTIWPRSKCFRCLFSEDLIKELSFLSLNHAYPELMDHFFIYKGEHAILEWHDAFANAMLISKVISEKKISEFASNLSLEYCEAKLS